MPCIDYAMTNPAGKPQLPSSLRISNFVLPQMITTPDELRDYLTGQLLYLAEIFVIDSEKKASRIIDIVSHIKDTLNYEDSRKLIGQLDENARKQFDDIMVMVMNPAALPYTQYDSQGTEVRLRKLALETLLQGQAVDPRIHNSRLGLSGIVFDVTFGALRNPDIKDSIKQGFVQTLLDQPRIHEFAPHLAAELQALDKTPSYTDYDGRPYPNHWARDALITLSDIVRPDLTGLSARGTKPASTAG